MKKLMILLGCILLLCGCTKKEERVVLDYQNDFITYKADMSGYEGLTSSNHRFLGITVSELKKAIDEDKSGIFVLSRKGCTHCQLLMRYMNEAANELDVYIYYIDAESNTYPILGTDDYDVLLEVMYPICEEIDGEVGLQTPHFFTIVNGEYVDSKIGDKANSVTPGDKESERIVSEYKKMMQKFTA